MMPTVPAMQSSGRQIDFLRVSVTDRGNKRCRCGRPPRYEGLRARGAEVADAAVTRPNHPATVCL